MEKKSLFGGGTSGFGDLANSGQNNGVFGMSTFNQPWTSSTGTGLGFGATHGTSSSIFGNTGGSWGVGGPFLQLNNTFGDNKPTTPGTYGPSFSGGAPGAFFVSNPKFGCSGLLATQLGTTFKYSPSTGSDTVVLAGVATSISTTHQCITAMKEYENKSLEELRLEDYQTEKKGPTNQMALGTRSLFSSAPAASAANTGLFHPTLPDNSFSFGQNKRTLEATNSPGFNNITRNLFGQQRPQHTSNFKMFGETTNTSFTCSNTVGQSNRISMGFFGNTAGTMKDGLFGNSSDMGLLGQTNAQFGNTNAFGNTSVGFGTQQSSLGNKTPGFPTTSCAVTPSFGNAMAITPCFRAASTPSLSNSMNTSSSGGTSSTFSAFGGNSSLTKTVGTNVPVTIPSLSTTMTPFYSGAGLMGNKTAFTLETGSNTSTNTVGVSGYKLAAKGLDIGLGSNSSTEVGAGQTFGMPALNPATSSMGLGAAHQPFSLVNPNAMAAQQAMLRHIHSYLTLTPYGDSSLFRNTPPDLRRETHPQQHVRPVNASVQNCPYNCPPPPIRTRPLGPSSLRSSESQLLFYLDDDEPSLNKRPFRQRKP